MGSEGNAFTITQSFSSNFAVFLSLDANKINYLHFNIILKTGVRKVWVKIFNKYKIFKLNSVNYLKTQIFNYNFK